MVWRNSAKLSFNPRPACRANGHGSEQIFSSAKGFNPRPACRANVVTDHRFYGLAGFNPRPACRANGKTSSSEPRTSCFNPRPACRANGCRSNPRPVERPVSIRALRAGRMNSMATIVIMIKDVSIRALRAGRMGGSLSLALAASGFNPRPACRANAESIRSFLHQHCFNPRPACRANGCCDSIPGATEVFQSAPCVQGE